MSITSDTDDGGGSDTHRAAFGDDQRWEPPSGEHDCDEDEARIVAYPSDGLFVLRPDTSPGIGTQTRSFDAWIAGDPDAGGVVDLGAWS